MDSDDGKEKGGVTAVRKGEAMKSLEKATADYEKAKEKMEDRKSTRLNSSHRSQSRMPSSA